MNKHKQPRWTRNLLWLYVVGLGVFHAWVFFCSLAGKRGKLPLAARQVSPDQRFPRVSIVLPARNEEANIRRSATSLLEQDYPNFELIVVNDDSTDATGAILAEIQASHPHGSRLKVLDLHELGKGWAGKPHALHSGIQQVDGEWLIFTDADTWHAPDAVWQTVSFARQESIDLLSLLTSQELPGFWENTMMPIIFMGISLLYPIRRVNNSASSLALANGQYVLIRREVYEDLGGYARPDMRHTLLDDRDLAQLVKDAGYQIRLVEGQQLVSVCMYRGLKEFWCGWRKNAYLGNHGFWAVLGQLLALPLITVLPFILPVFRSFFGVSKQEMRLATFWALFPWLVYRWRVNKYFSIPWYYIFTQPLSGVIFEGILAQSTWRIITRKGVDWRGRQYYDEQSEKVADTGNIKVS